MNKYHNKKVVFDNITFDSIKEMKRYQYLRLLQKANEISHLSLQEKFILQEAFKKNNVHYREISYIADFFYYDNKLKRWIVEDTKGFRTETYKMKKKLFEYKYKDLEIKEL